MRLLPGLVLALSLAWATSAEGRLFWQTYGSTVPSADGCGCTWNSNQDYFIPRHADSCRYGLFSPCKSSCTTSPACKRCHPLYPGYCTIYGPCHYVWRNHVYRAHCGCTRTPFRHGLCGYAAGTHACQPHYEAACPCVETVAPLYNVESPQFDILGSIPVEGTELLSAALAGQQSPQSEQLLKMQRDLMNQPPRLPLMGAPPAQ